MTVTEFIQILLTVVALCIAWLELNKWRTELLGSKRIDLAIRLSKTALNVMVAFKSARLPARLGSPDEPAERTHARAMEEEFNEHLQSIQSHLAELYEIRAEVPFLLNTDIDEYVKRLNAKFHELQAAMNRVAKSDNTTPKDLFDKAYATVFSERDDAFSKEIEQITEKLLAVAQTAKAKPAK